MRRRSAASLLVLAAVLALVAVGLVPRGLVRATAAQHLPPGPAVEETGLTDPADDLHLPGVRAVVGKEEDDDTLPEPTLSPASVASPAAAASSGSASAPPPGSGAPDATDVGAPAPGRAPPQTV